MENVPKLKWTALISIRAPRTGSDGRSDGKGITTFKISIHAPRTGSDEGEGTAEGLAIDFNPRSPHGERRDAGTKRGTSRQISIHAPRTGSDRAASKAAGETWVFQSTLPARGATLPSWKLPSVSRNFNPRSPHGERRRNVPVFLYSMLVHFNPRSPHGERLQKAVAFGTPTYFNPRSPHGERLSLLATFLPETNFNPRSPHGERRKSDESKRGLRRISIHAPRTGSDRAAAQSVGADWHFNPRSPHGERRSAGERISHFPPFQSTLPARGATRRWPTS